MVIHSFNTPWLSCLDDMSRYKLIGRYILADKMKYWHNSNILIMNKASKDSCTSDISLYLWHNSKRGKLKCMKNWTHNNYWHKLCTLKRISTDCILKDTLNIGKSYLHSYQPGKLNSSCHNTEAWNYYNWDMSCWYKLGRDLCIQDMCYWLS